VLEVVQSLPMASAEVKADQPALGPPSVTAVRASDTVELVLITAAPTVILRMAHAAAARFHLLVLLLPRHLDLQLRLHPPPHLRTHLQPRSPVTAFAEAKAVSLALALLLDRAVRYTDTVEPVLITAVPTAILSLARAMAAQFHPQRLAFQPQLHLEAQLRLRLQSLQP
jgi:hypothetical protein